MILVSVSSHSFGTVKHHTTLWAIKVLVDIGAMTCLLVSPQSRGSELLVTLQAGTIGHTHIFTFSVVLGQLLLVVKYLVTI